MRIVSGKYKGTKIAISNSDKTRATRDQVRESIFNILAHASWSDGIEDAKAMDVFAGTGALGLEAISRGVDEVIFVEKDRNAISVCSQNIKLLGVEKISKLITKDIFKLGARPNNIEVRDLIFLDPPYANNLGRQALEYLVNGGWLAEGAICVLEAAKKSPESIPSIFEQLESRSYGIAEISFLRYK